MRVLARFLVVFLTLRVLLQPHGVCLCELLEGLERSLARTFHTRIPLAPAEREDPLQGCVNCQIPAGVRGEHVTSPPPALCLEPPLAPETPQPAPESFPHAPQPPPLPPTRALYLSYCSLVI